MSAIPMPAEKPVTDLSTLPLILVLEEVARIYRRAVPTVRRDLQNGTFRPAPFAKFPYRWLRSDIEADLERKSAEQQQLPPPRTAPRRRSRRRVS
jgi:hypothetical protein